MANVSTGHFRVAIVEDETTPSVTVAPGTGWPEPSTISRDSEASWAVIDDVPPGVNAANGGVVGDGMCSARQPPGHTVSPLMKGNNGVSTSGFGVEVVGDVPAATTSLKGLGANVVFPIAAEKPAPSSPVTPAVGVGTVSACQVPPLVP